MPRVGPGETGHGVGRTFEVPRVGRVRPGTALGRTLEARSPPRSLAPARSLPSLPAPLLGPFPLTFSTRVLARQVWRVENFAKVEVEASLYGQFYSGDSYVLQYSYGAEGRESYVIYFWQGVDSSVDEKGSSALLAKELDDSLGGRATQVRVVQNKETDHFLTLFKGKFIVLRGGHKSGFKNAQADGTEAPAGSVRLFRVHGTSTLNTKAIQVRAHSSPPASWTGARTHAFARPPARM